MKKLRMCWIFVLCLTLLSGCDSKEKNEEAENQKPVVNVGTDNPKKEESVLTRLRDNMKTCDCGVGIAFLGYVDTCGNGEEIKEYVEGCAVAEEYPFLTTCEPVVYEGEELYAFVTAEKDDVITIYPAGFTEEGEYKDDKDTVIYQGNPGESVILRCNLSEIFANVLITVTNGDKNLEFHPMLSMKDGSVALEEGCYDFSIME